LIEGLFLKYAYNEVFTPNEKRICMGINPLEPPRNKGIRRSLIKKDVLAWETMYEDMSASNYGGV
jgi:hypothetical protein